jgi:hypothetical protein
MLKKGKDPSNGVPKIKLLKLHQKNTFSGFCHKFLQAMDEVEIFFANFQILGPLGYQGWVVIPQNVKIKSQNHCIILPSLVQLLGQQHVRLQEPIP